MSITCRELLGRTTLTKRMVDMFLDPKVKNWAVFDPELGYLLQDYVARDGTAHCYTINHYVPQAERRMIHYAGRPCRINTYGDSFTQCHQVSDGETWQEYLAAHLGEPVRNFGIGGYGVYQAYRRMLREEQTDKAAEYVILNMWCDDHLRSIYPWRWIHCGAFREHLVDNTEPYMFHANPWVHLRFDPDTGRFRESENSHPTPESLYKLCDEDYVYETFKDCFDVQARLAAEEGADVNVPLLQGYADALGVAVDFSTPESTVRAGWELLRVCSLRSSMYVADQANSYAAAHGKKLMIHLSYGDGDVQTACRGGERFDRMLVDYLQENGFLFVDTLEKHAEEFRRLECRCSPETYTQLYYIGHYAPRGNHFYAFAVKDAVAKWLVPPPPAYRESGPSLQELAATLA